MASIGVISKVDEPTPWYAGMVVVPKKNGAIRICVDLKPLNENALREVHPLPKVAGAQVFSKLDGILADATPKGHFTTFITPFGLVSTVLTRCLLILEGEMWNGLYSHAVPPVHTLTLLLVNWCVYCHMYMLPLALFLGCVILYLVVLSFV